MPNVNPLITQLRIVMFLSGLDDVPAATIPCRPLPLIVTPSITVLLFVISIGPDDLVPGVLVGGWGAGVGAVDGGVETGFEAGAATLTRLRTTRASIATVGWPEVPRTTIFIVWAFCEPQLAVKSVRVATKWLAYVLTVFTKCPSR